MREPVDDDLTQTSHIALEDYSIHIMKRVRVSYHSEPGSRV